MFNNTIILFKINRILWKFYEYIIQKYVSIYSHMNISYKYTQVYTSHKSGITY